MKRSPQDDANNGSFTPTTTVQLGLDERLTHCNGSLHNTWHMEISFLFIRLRLPACGGCRWKCNFPPKKTLKMRCAISRRQAGKLFSRITIQRGKFCLPMNHFLISLLPCDSKKGNKGKFILCGWGWVRQLKMTKDGLTSCGWKEQYVHADQRLLRGGSIARTK